MKNDSAVLFGAIFIAISLIAWKGAGIEQKGLFALAFDASISETSASSNTADLHQDQMIVMNGQGGSSIVSRVTMLSDNVFEDQIVESNEYIGSDSMFSNDREEITEYEVQEGDVLGGIASDFGITLQTIISANNIVNINALKPGAKLRIPPVDGIIYKIKKGDTVATLAKKFQAESSKILSYNDLSETGTLKIGDEIIIPGGIAPRAIAVASKQDKTTKRFSLLPRLDADFVAPATCVITQLVHGRNGVDCAAKKGTPIFAMASGTVNMAKDSGYNNGYGRVVRITHNNGTETLYGHLNEVFVSAGQTVSQGEQIGTMGNTGKSTGPHVHLEVHNARNILANYAKKGQVTAGK